MPLQTITFIVRSNLFLTFNLELHYRVKYENNFLMRLQNLSKKLFKIRKIIDKFEYCLFIVTIVTTFLRIKEKASRKLLTYTYINTLYVVQTSKIYLFCFPLRRLYIFLSQYPVKRICRYSSKFNSQYIHN